MTDNRILTYKVKETADRTVRGIAVPFGEITENYGYRERFAPEAFADAEPVQIFFNHDSTSTPIGKVQTYEVTDEGLEVVAKLSSTEKATEVHTLLTEGILDSFSIGVRPIESFDEDGVTVWTKAELFEISVVNRPAFKNARISEVHAEQNDNANKNLGKEVPNEMENFNEEVTEIKTGLESLEREFALIKDSAPAAPVKSDIHSYGEFVKKVAQGDKEATELLYAYTGGTSDDTVLKNTWVGDIINVVNNGRPVFNTFSKGQFPSEGNTVEFAKLESNSIAVAKQTAEGEDLTKGKVSFTTDRATIATYGGWVEMTVQEIERSNVNVLDTVWKGLAAKYAEVTEKVVVDAVKSVAATESLPVNESDWIDFIVGLGIDMKNAEGKVPTALILSKDAYLDLAKVKVADNYLLDRSNGSVNLSAYSGSVFNVPVVLSGDNALGAALVHEDALKTFESPGAPMRLQDSNIVNLTGAFSIYGYLAVAEQAKHLIVRAS